MKIICILFLSLLLIAMGDTAPCSQNVSNTNDLIEAGKFTIMKKTQSKHQCYILYLQYNIPQTGFDIILSLNDFNSLNYKNGVDFILRQGKGSKQNQVNIVLTTSNNQVWNSIQVNYFASSSTDIFIGSLNIETLNFLGCFQKNDKSITSALISNLPMILNKNYTILVFLSGLRTQSSNFSISFNKKQLNSQNNVLTVQVQKDKTSIIEEIKISYIIYANIPFQIFFSEKTQNTNYNYYFSGIQKLNFNGQTKQISNKAFGLKLNQMSITNLFLCVGKNCNKQCVSLTQCYVIGGKTIDSKCASCQSGQLYQNGVCQANCGQFQHRSIQTNQCVCYPQYLKYQGKCYFTCGQNAVWINNVCVCLEGYTQFGSNCFNTSGCKLNEINIEGKCQCRPNFILFNNSCQQVPKCGTNQYLVDLSCLCVLGYQKINGKCSLIKCGENQQLINNKCVCKTGYKLVKAKCQQVANFTTCGQNQQYNGTICVCLKGYQKINGTCKIINNCINQNYIFVNGKCSCKAGFIELNGNCLQIPKCEANQQLSGLTCVCISGYQKFNKNICQPIVRCKINQVITNQNKCICQEGYVYSINRTCQQILKCQENEQYQQSSNKCICKSDYIMIGKICQQIALCNPQSQIIDLTKNKCICQQNYIRIGGVCEKIAQCNPQSQIIDLTTNKCICQQKYIRIGGVCQKIAQCNPQSQFLDQANNKCLCNKEYVLIGGVCLIIPHCNPLSEVLDTTVNKCICNKGFILFNNGCKNIQTLCKANQEFSLKDNSCICKANYMLQNGLCIEIPCGTNQVRVNGICTCAIGYIQLGPICAPICGINQQLLLNSCTCKQGYDRINGTCRKCPQNSKVNLNKSVCQCNTGYIFDSSQINCILVCGQNQIKQIANGKQVCQCNQGYARDNLGKCILINSIQCPPRSIWNQQKLICQCTVQGQYLIDLQCQKCKQNSGWNGEQCVCLTGFYLIAGKCSSCPSGTVYNGNKCVCNLRYYQNATGQCQRCHDSCLQCKGPNSNECLICSDIKLKLQLDGTCSQNETCAAGQYPIASGCGQCSAYCQQCSNSNTCNSCINGYQLKNISLGGVNGQFCFEICGDGKKFELPCDDGNLIDGDGCSSKCEIQPGYTCAGGSSTRPSTCQITADVRSIITPRKGVLLFGRIVYGIYLTNIPAPLRQNSCLQCSKLLTVSVVQSTLIPQVKAQYIPTSQYQYLIEFNFFGLLAIPPFTFTVKLNQKYKDNFSKEDLDQLIIIKVDPSLLAQADDALTLDVLDLNIGITNNEGINVSQATIDSLFS